MNDAAPNTDTAETGAGTPATADGTMHRHPYPVMAALALTGLIVGIARR